MVLTPHGWDSQKNMMGGGSKNTVFLHFKHRHTPENDLLQ